MDDATAGDGFVPPDRTSSSACLAVASDYYDRRCRVPIWTLSATFRQGRRACTCCNPPPKTR